MILCKNCKKIIGLTEVTTLYALCGACEQLQSNARQHLHTTFDSIIVGQRFQFVNSVMGGATPKGHWFVKISETECLYDGEVFTVESNTKVER